MANENTIDKYLNKKEKYEPVDDISNLFRKTLDKAKKDQATYSKKMDKMLIRDENGKIIFEFNEGVIVESEDGVMAYTTAHPHGGRGRQGYNKGIVCPNCGATIDLRR